MFTNEVRMETSSLNIAIWLPSYSDWTLDLHFNEHIVFEMQNKVLSGVFHYSWQD